MPSTLPTSVAAHTVSVESLLTKEASLGAQASIPSMMSRTILTEAYVGDTIFQKR